MDLTANFGLGKPLDGENYDVHVFNNNADIIDFQLDAHRDRLDERDNLYPISAVPRCRLRQTSAQSIANNTPETLDMATANIDYDWTTPMADKANDCIVIKKAGLYIVSLRVVWAVNNTGTRFALIDLNGTGTQLAEDYRDAASSNTIVTLTTEPVALVVNDKISGRVSQSSGGALSTATANGRYCTLSATYVGPSA